MRIDKKKKKKKGVAGGLRGRVTPSKCIVGDNILTV